MCVRWSEYVIHFILSITRRQRYDCPQFTDEGKEDRGDSCHGRGSMWSLCWTRRSTVFLYLHKTLAYSVSEP